MKLFRIFHEEENYNINFFTAATSVEAVEAALDEITKELFKNFRPHYQIEEILTDMTLEDYIYFEYGFNADEADSIEVGDLTFYF